MTGVARLFSRPAPARRWITALALLAFFLQSLTVQTHVHQPFQAGTVASISLDGAKAPLKAPLKADPDQCRFCQELVHAGSFITPAALIGIADPSIAAIGFSILTGLPAGPATAFAWHSRAPPRP